VHDLIPRPATAGALVAYEAELDAVRSFAANEKAESTRRAYTSGVRLFTAWCRERGLCPLPTEPETVGRYISSIACDGLSVSSIGQRLAGIAYAHKLAKLPSPCGSEEVRVVLAGIRRTVGTAPTHRKQPVTAERLTQMLVQLPDTIRGKRDRALLALGFAGAFRRSELVALTVADLVLVDDGYRVTIRRSKTDQTGASQEIAIPRGYRLRPVEAVQAWLQAASITTGPVFRRVTARRLGGRGKPVTELVGEEALTGHSVALTVKRHCRRAGLDPAEFSGHSLRSGYVTSCVENNAPIMKIAEQTRHVSLDMLRVYSRRVDLFREHSGAAFL
jgi:integrase